VGGGEGVVAATMCEGEVSGQLFFFSRSGNVRGARARAELGRASRSGLASTGYVVGSPTKASKDRVVVVVAALRRRWGGIGLAAAAEEEEEEENGVG
jgi:hypothetical protein